MSLINMTSKDGVTLKTAGKYCAEDITIVPTFESGGSASFNIHYGTEAPEDTSKLWVETDTEPTETRVTGDIRGECSMTMGVSAIPTAAHYIAAGVVGTKVYLFGGRNDDQNFSTINVFDTETNTITTLSTTLPSAASRMAAGVVGTKVYLFGGYTSSAISTIYVFDTETNTITTLSAKLPTSAYGITAGVVGTKVYLFGGYTGSSYLNYIYVFDTEANTITKLSTTLPSKACDMAAGVVGTKVYLFGGLIGGGSSCLSTINVFDAETNTITKLSTTLPNTEHSVVAGAVGTKVYLFGGRNNATDLSTINLFTVKADLTENTAAVVPSLTENVIPLMDVVELGVSAVYIGNADGVAEQVNAYLHNGTEWALI